MEMRANVAVCLSIAYATAKLQEALSNGSFEEIPFADKELDEMQYLLKAFQTAYKFYSHEDVLLLGLGKRTL